jgi:hypothetical protein
MALSAPPSRGGPGAGSQLPATGRVPSLTVCFGAASSATGAWEEAGAGRADAGWFSSAASSTAVLGRGIKLVLRALEDPLQQIVAHTGADS